MVKNNIEKNYKYFKKNYDELKKKYKGCYVVIKDEEVVFSNKIFEKVINFAKELEAGTYIIQEVKEDFENSTRVFHSRVRLNG